MMGAVEKISGYQVFGVFAQLMLSEDLNKGAYTVWRDEEQKKTADYFERTINAFGNYAEIEENVSALKLPYWIHCLTSTHCYRSL